MKKMLHNYSDLMVCDLLKYGFPIGYDESEIQVQSSSSDNKLGIKNHKGARDFPTDLEKYLIKEATNKAIIGPFSENPFAEQIKISPLNTVPKANKVDRRVILDLSFPKDGSAVNDHISKDSYLGEEVLLVFPKIDDFVALIKSKGQGCLMYKLDLSRAYRQISICPSNYNLVAFSWKGHIFCDTVLSMGLRSAAQICQRVTNAFANMMWNFGVAVLNYLDDFAGAENKVIAPFAFSLLRSLLVKSGIDEAMEKACSPSTLMIFLGVLFDSESMAMQVTPDKLSEIKLLIKEWLNRTHASLKDIQKLLGKLNFVGACVRSSRVFINRILNWLRECYAHNDLSFPLPLEVKQDLCWWDKFLPLYNGISLIDYGEWSVGDGIFLSDSCLSGCGGMFGSQFFHREFPKFIMEKKIHISGLELLSVIVCLKLWGSQWKGKKIIIFCDNQAACIVVNSGKARCRFLQQCLREICFLASIHEFQVKACHLEGSANRLSDCLSRWHLHSSYQLEFQRLCAQLRELTELNATDSCFQFSHEW
ncbi:uncharacterized protein LOC128546268 isoform X1 [Mercenaria mercenaria]|uniref:uncharacterized protein LOC128546268 isoform X1 n=1 Tax=Mercenaria mercenaria TaxID=6596 RepID=UPI00234FA266|nr:uncharacterized protein LOC128546268 isoform X1 [Mercenaria mercenaria]